MRGVLFFVLVLIAVYHIPIQTLGAVRDLLHSTRGRLQAVGQAYQALMAEHPNHRPNPHFDFDSYTSSNRPVQQNYNSYRPQQQNYNGYRPQQQNNRFQAQQQNYNYRPQQQNYNRRRIHNSKALVQPRENALADNQETTSRR